MPGLLDRMSLRFGLLGVSHNRFKLVSRCLEPQRIFGRFSDHPTAHHIGRAGHRPGDKTGIPRVTGGVGCYPWHFVEHHGDHTKRQATDSALGRNRHSVHTFGLVQQTIDVSGGIIQFMQSVGPPFHQRVHCFPVCIGSVTPEQLGHFCLKVVQDLRIATGYRCGSTGGCGSVGGCGRLHFDLVAIDQRLCTAGR